MGKQALIEVRDEEFAMTGERPEFGEILRQAIESSPYKSNRRFAEAVRHSHTNVNQIIHGDRTPPPELLEKWADKLGLSGDRREAFIAAGMLARAGARRETSGYVKSLERRVRTTETNYKLAVDLLLQLAGAAKKRGVELSSEFLEAVADLKKDVDSIR